VFHWVCFQQFHKNVAVGCFIVASISQEAICCSL